MPNLLMELDKATVQKRSELVRKYLAYSNGILHLGAHYGQERDQYLKLGKSVVWVEANPETFFKLERNIKDYSEQRAICALLSDTNGEPATFHVSNNFEGVSSSIFSFGDYAAGSNSLWPELDLKMVDELTLQTSTLDALLKEHKILPKDYNFWVVDLQGAEELFLLGAKESLEFCKSLLVEVSTVEVYRDGSRWESLCSLLEGLGFSPIWQPERPHDDVLFLTTQADDFDNLQKI